MTSGRSSPTFALLCAAIAVVAELADITSTLRNIQIGAIETNPLMAGLFDHGIGTVIGVKLAVAAVAAAVIILRARSMLMQATIAGVASLPVFLNAVQRVIP